jgi:transposase InsO family protein
MMISLHKNATTTPGIRQRLSGSDEPASVLALRYGVSEETARKWKRRDSVRDLSATPHNLQTTLSVAQEAVVVELRRFLLLPLDDLLAVTREFLNPEVSRSGLDRCLRRHGVSNLKALLPKTPAEPRKTFKAYEPGFLHVDVKYLPQMADETTRRYLFVAIDRPTRWVFVRIMPAKTAANARRFLRDLNRACPIRITKLLTDNGKEFTDRLFASRARAASGDHEFDQLCVELGIEHRLTPPKSPQTNGMVERFNGRIADVLKTNRFDSALDLEQTLMRYVALYNTQLPQSVLGSRTPMQAMKDWHKSHPHLFVKSPRNLPGRDTYAPSESSYSPAIQRTLVYSLALAFHSCTQQVPGVKLFKLSRLAPFGSSAPHADPILCSKLEFTE